MTTTRTVTLGRMNVPCRCHVCAFFSDSDDEEKVVLPFMREGLHTGDKTVCIMDQSLRSERLRRLAESGFDIANAEVSGQLELRSWENAPLQPARFDRGAMIELVEEVAKAGGKNGKGATRLWVNMEWALSDSLGTNDIAEYESWLNRLLPNYDMATVCAYDVTKFSAAVVMDVLRTHPHVIVGGILRENPFYVPPDDFLREFDTRKASAASSVGR
jgi:hypothetical protein